MNKTPIRSHYDEIDILRGLAILMVLCYHSILVFPVNLHEITWCKSLHSFLWMIEMPLFFLVSGFCFSYPPARGDKTVSGRLAPAGSRSNLLARDVKPRMISYGSYIWKKCKRILVPHVVFCGLDILMRILPTGLVNQTGDASTLLKEFFLFGGSDWFLWTLFVLLLIFPLFHWIFSKGILGKEIVILIVCLLYFLRDFLPNVLLLSTAAEFLPYFFIGYMIRYSGAYETVRQNLVHPGVVVIAFLSDLLFVMMAFRLQNGQPLLWFEVPMLTRLSGRIEDILGFLIAMNSAVLALKLADLILRGPDPFIRYLDKDENPLVDKSNNRIFGFFSNCSRYSLQMYLLDGYALVVTRTILVSVLGITNPVVIILGNFILDTAIVLVISKYIIDKVKLFRFLCGLG